MSLADGHPAWNEHVQSEQSLGGGDAGANVVKLNVLSPVSSSTRSARRRFSGGMAAPKSPESERAMSRVPATTIVAAAWIAIGGSSHRLWPRRRSSNARRLPPRRAIRTCARPAVAPGLRSNRPARRLPKRARLSSAPPALADASGDPRRPIDTGKILPNLRPFSGELPVGIRFQIGTSALLA